MGADGSIYLPGDLSRRPKEQWLALARKLEIALTGKSGRLADDRTGSEFEALAAKAHTGRRFHLMQVSGAGASGACESV